MPSSGFTRKTAAVTLGVFLWFTLGAAVARCRQIQEDPVSKARQLVRQGDYEGAIKVLEDYIAKIRLIAEQKKNIAEAYYIIAKIYYIVGEDQDSEANLRRVFETFPAFSIDEPDLTFRERVKRVKEVVSAEQKAKVEEKPLAKEKEQPVAIGKAGEVKKRGFPWLIAAGVVVAGGALAVLLLKKKTSAPQVGSISIVSNPSGAKVYLDNTLTGQITDCTLNNISAGTHALKIELENYGKWEGNVEVKSGQTANVNMALSGYAYELVTKWGSLGTGDGQFNTPAGVAADNLGNLFVVEYQNHRLQKFTIDGAFLYKWGSQGSGNGQFQFPSGIAIDKSNYVYVSEQTGNCVKKFQPGGFFVTKWGSSGSGDGQFNVPAYIAVDRSADVVYVSDFNNNRIQKFTSGGSYLSKWGGMGSGDGQLYRPMGVAVDGSGYVYVSDGGNNRIQKFTSGGSFVAKWGSEGTGDGQLRSPDGIAADYAGHIYVADELNYRIQKFNSDGAFMTKWGSQGSGDGQFKNPDGVAVDDMGFVYVADKFNHRIQKFQITTHLSLSVTITYSPLNSSSKFTPFMNRPVLKLQSSDGQLFKRSKSTRSGS